MAGTWELLLRTQHVVWAVFKCFLLTGAVLCVLAIVLGVGIGKYFNWKEIRSSRGKT
jgi:hypothetical protein